MRFDNDAVHAKLRLAAETAAVMELEQLEALLTVPHVFSDNFEHKMAKLLKLSRKPYYSLINTAGKRAAAVIIAVILTFSILTFSVEAIRTPVVRFITQVYEKFTVIVFHKEDMPADAITPDDSFPSTIEHRYLPEYIPDGYRISDEFDAGNMFDVTYSKEGAFDVTFQQYTIANNNLTVDTEGVDMEYISVGEYPALLVFNKGFYILTWADSSYGYQIIGDLDREEIVKMAQSVGLKP